MTSAKRILYILALVPCYAHADTSLHDAIENVRASCGNISAELTDMKKMAGITTAVTGVGTVAGGVALGTGLVKAKIDKEIHKNEELIAALEEAKEAALDDINRLALDIEREANIETLVLSKGFEQCVAVISDDSCNVIVKTTGLLPGDVAQISEIVYEQAGILPDNLKIIEKTDIET